MYVYTVAYGMTECGVPCTIPRNAKVMKPGSAGVPLPSVEMKVQLGKGYV